MMRAKQREGLATPSRERKGTPAGGRAGFTLLEVMVAVLILGLAYVAVLQSFSLSFKNILRVEASKDQTLAAVLAFENTLRPADEEAGEPPKEPVGPVYLEGQKYNLILVTSKGGQFASLRLAKPGMNDRE